jgi:hypothetical protein
MSLTPAAGAGGRRRDDLVRVGVEQQRPPERGPLGLVEAGAVEELVGLQRRDLLLLVGEPDLGDAAPEELVGARPERDPGVDLVLADLRNLARELHRVHLEPVPLELGLAHARLRVGEDQLMDHAQLLVVVGAWWCGRDQTL